MSAIVPSSEANAGELAAAMSEAWDALSDSDDDESVLAPPSAVRELDPETHVRRIVEALAAIPTIPFDAAWTPGLVWTRPSKFKTRLR